MVPAISTSGAVSGTIGVSLIAMSANGGNGGLQGPNAKITQLEEEMKGLKLVREFHYRKSQEAFVNGQKEFYEYYLNRMNEMDGQIALVKDLLKHLKGL